MPRYTPKDLDPIIDELAANNDRAKAIVGGALLDSSLDYAITARLVGLEPGAEETLFSLAGPFGTCDQKIQGAFALGLIGPVTKRDMGLVNKIRNLFAHDVNPVSFSDQAVAGRCRDLQIGLNSDVHEQKMWREKFVLAVHLLCDGLIMDANERTDRVGLSTKHLSD